MSRKRIFRRLAGGFTLIEVIAVVVLMGLIATAGALSLRSARHNVVFDDVLAQLREHDDAARACARRFGRPVRLIIEQDRVKWEVVERDSAATVSAVSSSTEVAPIPPRSLPLPPGYALEIVRAGQWARKEGVVRISSAGRSPSYALRLSGPADRWRELLFSGLSGHCTELHDDARAQDILALLRR